VSAVRSVDKYLVNWRFDEAKLTDFTGRRAEWMWVIPWFVLSKLGVVPLRMFLLRDEAKNITMNVSKTMLLVLTHRLWCLEPRAAPAALLGCIGSFYSQGFNTILTLLVSV
jgi:hypothetical protein